MTQWEDYKLMRRIILLLILPVLASAQSELPDGRGKDLVQSSCTDCHSVDRIMAQRLDEDGWNAIVREMIESGAAINPNDMKAIVSYLAKNFGPGMKININKAGNEEIGGVLKLTPAEAAAIVQYRTQHGSFKDLTELEKVNGLAEKIEAKKALIEF
jgi:competence ComEA-like helix-hairpin-helix protein